MIYDKYLNEANCLIPNEILKNIDDKNITLTSFENCNEILTNSNLKTEFGYKKMPNGDYLVSMFCPIPNVTKEMIDFWFWWHPQEKERYQMWYPGEHFGISYEKSKTNYFSKTKCPPFEPNVQYPVEKIGKLKMPLAISFLNPTDFGFEENLMKENGVSTIVCGHVSAFKGLVDHTEMAHIFFESDNGLYLVSRFWLGKRLKNPVIRKAMLTDETARGMAIHCCVEYRNLAKKLPNIYKEFNN